MLREERVDIWERISGMSERQKKSMTVYSISKWCGIKIMNNADIKQYDVANGLGIRVSLFVSGCTHHCKNCFNKETWDFRFGNPFTEAEIEKILEYLKPSYVSGLSLLGGEPFEPENHS